MVDTSISLFSSCLAKYANCNYMLQLQDYYTVLSRGYLRSYNTRQEKNITEKNQ